MTLRYLRDSGTTRKLSASLSPPGVISVIHITWMNIWQGLVSAFRRVYDVVQYPFSWEILSSCTTSSIRSVATKVGHQMVTVLLRVDRKIGNAKGRLIQSIRKLRRAGLFPTTIEDAHSQLPVPRNGTGLWVCVWNLERIRRQNADNSRCVWWVLRNKTDSEAIDSAIRLAGSIQRFDGDFDHDPPSDLIVSAPRACFDSTKQPYPRTMRDQAYFSARATLQINMGARAQLHEHTSKYPIPAVSSSSFQHTDPDLQIPEGDRKHPCSLAVSVKLARGCDPCGPEPDPEILPVLPQRGCRK